MDEYIQHKIERKEEVCSTVDTGKRMNIWYGKETLNMIDGLCKEGVDIPLAVKVVVKVEKNI